MLEKSEEIDTGKSLQKKFSSVMNLDPWDADLLAAGGSSPSCFLKHFLSGHNLKLSFGNTAREAFSSLAGVLV